MYFGSNGVLSACKWWVHMCLCDNIHFHYTEKLTQTCPNVGPPCCMFPPVPSRLLVQPSPLLQPNYSSPSPQIPRNEIQCQAIS